MTRISHVVLALRAHGIVVDVGALDVLSTKAPILADEFGDWRPTKMVRRLRTRFSVAALRTGEDPDDAHDNQQEIKCIGELILAASRSGERRALARRRSGVPRQTSLRGSSACSRRDQLPLQQQVRWEQVRVLVVCALPKV